MLALDVQLLSHSSPVFWLPMLLDLCSALRMLVFALMRKECGGLSFEHKDLSSISSHSGRLAIIRKIGLDHRACHLSQSNRSLLND